MDCGTVGLSEGNNDNSCMSGMQQRNCMVKVAIRSQNGCSNALGCRKYSIVIISRIANIIKTHGFVSALFYQVSS